MQSRVSLNLSLVRQWSDHRTSTNLSLYIYLRNDLSKDNVKARNEESISRLVLPEEGWIDPETSILEHYIGRGHSFPRTKAVFSERYKYVYICIRSSAREPNSAREIAIICQVLLTKTKGDVSPCQSCSTFTRQQRAFSQGLKHRPFVNNAD